LERKFGVGRERWWVSAEVGGRTIGEELIVHSAQLPTHAAEGEDGAED